MSGSFNTIPGLSNRVCLPNYTEDLHLNRNAFDMIAEIWYDNMNKCVKNINKIYFKKV